MRIGYSLGSLLSIDQVLECSKLLSNTRVDTIWIPETWGMENFSILSQVSQRAPNSKIGSSIINIYSRSPSLIAMGAATVDTISNGRLILGLGTSSIPIVADFHGQKFENPILRMKESIEVIRLVLSGAQINYSGKIFKLKNFKILIKPNREKIPIYVAAVNSKMVNLAWNIADGVIFYLRPINEMKNTIQKMQSIRKIDVTCQIISCVSDDAEVAIKRAKQTLAFYISVGTVYREFLKNNGFKTEIKNIYEEFKISGLKSNYELIPDNMLDSLAICGTPEKCKKQINKFRDSGISLPIIQFNPAGDVIESFKLSIRTFSEDN